MKTSMVLMDFDNSTIHQIAKVLLYKEKHHCLQRVLRCLVTISLVPCLLLLKIKKRKNQVPASQIKWVSAIKDRQNAEKYMKQEACHDHYQKFAAPQIHRELDNLPMSFEDWKKHHHQLHVRIYSCKSGTSLNGREINFIVSYILNYLSKVSNIHIFLGKEYLGCI